MTEHITATLAAPECAVNWQAFDLADEDCPGRPAEAVIWQQCSRGHFAASLACASCIAVMASLCDFGDYGCGQCAHEGSYRVAPLVASALGSAPKPIGFVVALRFSDGTWDPDSPDCAGMWPTRELAAADAADPEMAGRLVNGQQWVVCGLVPIEDGKHD